MFEYKAEVLKVLDGDTIEVSLDLGLGIRYRTPLRLYGINAPEIHTMDLDEKDAGLKALTFVERLVSGKTVRVKTIKPKDKYGRYLAEVYLIGEGVAAESVQEQLVKAGLAKPWDGRGVRPI